MTEHEPKLAQASTLAALGWMLVALASFTMVAISGRAAAPTMATVDLMMLRSWLSLGVVVLAAAITGAGVAATISTHRLPLHVGRGIAHFGAQWSWLSALSMIPLAQLFALEFTAPLWVAMLAPLVVGERLTLWRVAAAVVGFAGALTVMARPGAVELGPGTLLALASALGFALSMLGTKLLTRSDSTLTILFYMFLIQSVISLPAALDGIGDPDAWAWAGLIGVTGFGLIAHYSLARAFALADAMIVAPMDFLRLPIIALIGSVLYAEPLDPMVLAGGLVIILGNLLNLWGERRRMA